MPHRKAQLFERTKYWPAYQARELPTVSEFSVALQMKRNAATKMDAKGAAKMTRRYKGRPSAKTIARDFPFIVELAVPLGGYGKNSI